MVKIMVESLTQLKPKRLNRRLEELARNALPCVSADLNLVNFEAEWRAWRNLTLKAAALRYRQSSTDPAANYSGSQVTLSLSLLL